MLGSWKYYLCCNRRGSRGYYKVAFTQGFVENSVMYDRYSGRSPIPFSSPCCLNGSNPRPTLRHRLPCARRIANGRNALHPTTCSSIDLNHTRPRWLSHEQGYPTMPILVQWSTSSSIEQAYYGAGRSQSQMTLTVQQIRHTQILWHLCLIRLWRRSQLNTV